MELDYDNYWLRRASEEVIEGWGLGRADLDGIRFSTKELAAEAARAILQRHMELTPHCAYPRFESADDLVAAARSIGGAQALSASSEGRFIGEPTFTNRGDRVEMARPNEVRLVSHDKVTKTVVVDGETYIREVEGRQESDWFKGAPVLIGLDIIIVNQVTAD